MITIYGMTDSGNCYKPRLLLAKLGRPFRHVEVNSLDGSTRKPDFLAINANGKVPVLELDDGRRVAESNAILLFLAENTRFLPADPLPARRSPINGCSSSNTATSLTWRCAARS